MKKFSFALDQRQYDEFFTPIRNKRQVISLLMKVIKLMIINKEAEGQNIKSEMNLIVSKMSRLIFISADKYFSINFPLTTIEGSDRLYFSSKYIADVDNKITSYILSIISNKKFLSGGAYDFVEPIIDIDEDENKIWGLLLELFLFEDGYIRYDHDEINENGALHPLDHYDIFYSSNSTFKVGLHSRVTPEVLIDLLHSDTNCHFIQQN